MGGLFGEGGAGAANTETVTAVRPVGREGRLVSVIVGRRSAGRLPPEVAERLGVRAGESWTAEMAGAVGAAHRTEAAHEAALKRLSRRARSEAELREWLGSKGHAPGAVAEAIDRLRAAGLVGDAALAREVVAQAQAKAPAGAALIEDRLRRRGLEAEAAPLVARSSDAEGALALARTEAATLARSADAAKAARRILGVLARRGFDPASAEEAVRAALAERGVALPEGDSYDP